MAEHSAPVEAIAKAAGSAATVVPAAANQIGYGARFLGKHGWRILLAFVGILLPLLFFASLVG